MRGVNREAAVEFVRARADKETTVRHLISVEGVMRALARRFGECRRILADPDVAQRDLARRALQPPRGSGVRKQRGDRRG